VLIAYFTAKFIFPIKNILTSIILYCILFVSIVETIAIVFDCLRRAYNATRFNTDKDTWPPLPKHFTTLAFIYHKNERTPREVITIEASQSGHINDIMQATGSHESNITSEE